MIFGGSGQVGRELMRSMAPVAEIMAPGLGDIPRIDLANFGALETLIARAKPDIIINAAAYTAVDRAETDRDLAAKINAEAPGVIARAARIISSPVVHYSTDYVFAGKGVAFHSERDETGPVNHYGATKLAGEEAVKNANPLHLIFRTSWVYSIHGSNFAKTILRLAAERESLNVVADQFGSPTAASLIADATAQAVSKIQPSNECRGLYHLVASGTTNWFEYASFLVELAAKEKLLARMPTIRSVATGEFKQVAQRPRNSRLLNKKFTAAFDYPLPEWQTGVEEFVNQLAAEKIES